MNQWLGSANARDNRFSEKQASPPRRRSAALSLRDLAQRHPLVFFLLGTFAWSWGIWLGLIAWGLSPATKLWDVLYILGLSGPTLTAFGVSGLTGGRGQIGRLLGRVGTDFTKLPWATVALCLPVLLAVAALALSLPWPSVSANVPASTLPGLVLFFGIKMFRSGPVNEEFGWRGFLLPRLLQRFSPLTASLLLAPVWTAWHLPLWFLPLLPHKYWPFSWFVLLVFPVTLLFTWVHLRTRGQLLYAILLHAAINTSVYYLPVLPPRQSSFAPFIAWIALNWAVALIVVARGWREWMVSPWPAPPRVTGRLWVWPRLQQCLAVMNPARSCRSGKGPAA